MEQITTSAVFIKRWRRLHLLNIIDTKCAPEPFHKCKVFYNFNGENSDWSPNKSGDSKGEPKMVDMHLSIG